jgi:molecular chaperone GrpE
MIMIDTPKQDQGTNTPLEDTGQETEANHPAETEDLQAQHDKMKDQWLRAVAELENTRRRAQKDREDALKYAATNFSRDILGVYDSLSRAAEMVGQLEQPVDEIKGFVDGVHLTLSELNSIFTRHGVKQIAPLNQPFDPNFHQAMFEVPTNEVAPGTVVQVMQVGFTIHDRLLRPALVGVSKKGD